jgi:guanylate kinase
MSTGIPQKRLGMLLVVSGPSASGKTTLCRRLSDQGEAVYSISCTTRQPRAGEEDGKDYFFLSDEDFVQRIERGEFFEHAHVHGRRYGTLKSFVTDNLLQGVDVVMDIDVQGAAQVRACKDALVQMCLVDVFILPPSVEELRQRLSGRGTETEQAAQLRLDNAIAEMQHWREYSYTLVSGSREADAARFRAMVDAERMRVVRLLPAAADE